MNPPRSLTTGSKPELEKAIVDGGAATIDWQGCYELQWSGVIVPGAFCHPAKFSRGLIERIYDFALAQGWLRRGDVVGDPFGGVGCGGIVAAYRGFLWRGVELEPRFVALGQENFVRHAGKWRALGCPPPVLVPGDSRRFDGLMGGAGRGADAIVTSPPYADSISAKESGIDWSKGQGGRDFTKEERHQELRKPMGLEYGAATGQIGSLKSGSLDGVVTSPPYADIAAGAGGLNSKPARAAGQQCGRKGDSASQSADQRYGAEAGQISACRAGDLDAVVTSPPYDGIGNGGPDYNPHLVKGTESPKLRADDYGTSTGQIGQSKGETYWEAMRAVYGACWAALRPGGVMAVVVKDYVARGARVRLCDDTCRLLVHVGFRVELRARAWLVAEQQHGDLFEGVKVVRRERKSFFRRLHEKRPGAIKIDWEEVIFAMKPRCTKGSQTGSTTNSACGRARAKKSKESLINPLVAM